MIVTETSGKMATEIGELEQQVLDLGMMVQTSISRVITSLLHRDTLMAKAVIREDEDIDRREVEIHEKCLGILEDMQPRGEDLRFVVAVLKINDSLERIGDLSENVAHVIVDVGDWDRFRRVKGIEELADQARHMVNDVLQSLVQRNAAMARKVIQDDDRTDKMYEQIKSRIEYELDRIPENANPLLRLEFVTRQFERIGDVATNIAEEVVYLVEDKVVRHGKA